MKRTIAKTARLAVLIVATVALTGAASDDAKKAAGEFLALLGQGKFAQARSAATPNFQRAVSAAALEKVAKQNGLDRYKSVRWTSYVILGAAARLNGTVITASDRHAVKMRLVRLDGTWRVSALTLPGGKGDTIGAAGAPSVATVKVMIFNTIMDFHFAVNTGDFRAMHLKMAEPLRRKFTPQQLAQTFAVFVRQKPNIAGAIRNKEPILSRPPRLSPDGDLTLEGYYPTAPSRLHFSLRYRWEAAAWRLIGININLRNQ